MKLIWLYYIKTTAPFQSVTIWMLHSSLILNEKVISLKFSFREQITSFYGGRDSDCYDQWYYVNWHF